MSSVLQTIESKDLSLTELLSGFYVVPSYQREYVWQHDQVEQLLADIYDEFSSERTNESEYFIGSLVVLGLADETYELIDGQQRMTTLFVILCAIRDHLAAAGRPVPATLLTQISAPSITPNGDEIHRYRVDLQYDDSRGVLEQLGSGAAPNGDLPQTRSVTNIQNAYATAREFLTRQFHDNEQELRRFYSFLTRRVKLIRVKTASVAHALKVFETINDRGMGLDSMDLLKNLLFMHAQAEQFDTLKGIWKELVDTLYRINEKPLRFLRYFIYANYTIGVEGLREDEVYRWFVDHESEVRYKSDPIRFARTLRQAAHDYVRFLEGKNADGTPNRYLDNIRYLSGVARYHLIVLLAARNLEPAAFLELCRHLENLFFAYIITREATRDLERAFIRWSPALRAARTLADLDAIFQEHLQPAKQALAARFEQAFVGLGEDDLQKYRMIYVLAKLTQYVDELAQGGASAAGQLKTYINSGVQLEHIFPQHPSADVLAAFDRPEAYRDYIGRLGNLTLLERSINSSVGNGLFVKKQSAYTQSNFLLTRSLGKPISVGVNTAYDRAAQLLEDFSTWASADIERRQLMLVRLARHVWDMPPARALSASAHD